MQRLTAIAAAWFSRVGFAGVCLVCASMSAASDASELRPLLAVPGEVVVKDDFSQAAELDKSRWAKRQGTRWEIVDGVLRGRPSSPEFQAARKDHKGLEPRLSVPATPAEFVAAFAVRFVDGEETAIVPFVEFGHHVARLKFSRDGLSLLADHESVVVAEAGDFRYEPGRTYRVLAELKGDELVVQFAGGPTLYAKHPCFAKPAPSGGVGLGLAGPKGGLAELDDLTIWSIRAEPRPDWNARRETLPKFTPVAVEKKPAKRASAK